MTIRAEGYYPVRLHPADIGERRVVEVILHPNGGLRAQVAIPGEPRDLEYLLLVQPIEVPRWKDASEDRGLRRVTQPGDYVIEDLPAGRYAILVTSDGGENQDWIVGREDATVADGETAEVRLELPEHFQIRGAVTEGGKPVAGKRVCLSSTQDGREYRLRAKLDERGRFTRSACVAGRYTISVAIGGDLRQLAVMEITGDTELDLELKR